LRQYFYSDVLSNLKPVLTVPLYEIKPAPGRGLGLFATTTIKSGTEILREEPIFKGSTNWFSKHAMFNLLPEDKKRSFMDLHSQCNCGKQNCEETEFMKIWDSNSFEVTVIPPLALPAYYAGPFVYLLSSRINHDCAPNTVRGSTNKCQVVFRAIKDIEAGEEITTDYMGLGFLPVSSRRQQLLEKYQFKCICLTCTKNVQLSTADILKGDPCKLISRPGLPVIGQHPPKLEQAFAEVDSWYQMIQSKIEDIMQNATLDIAKTMQSNNDKFPMTTATVGLEKLNRIYAYLLKNDKYNLGATQICIILHKLEHTIYVHTDQEFLVMKDLLDKVKLSSDGRR
jgi:hypothetical protein